MTRVLFVEASTGGVVGGSLSGLYHLIRGMDRRRFEIGMVLYEAKRIEGDLAALAVPVHHIARARLPKEHALLGVNGYHRAKEIGPVRASLRMGRQGARLLAEEVPAAVALARVIRRTKPDVVHLGNGLRANFDAFLACWMTRTPTVCHVKGFEKYAARERWASRRTAVVVCMTEAIREYCRERGLAAPALRVVYDALDESCFAPGRDRTEVRASLGVPAGAPCVGIIGNVQAWKGQDVLVEAMARVVRAHPAARCLIVGGVHRAGRKYADELRRRVAALGLEERVSFVGFRDDVPDVLQALDVVVHASVRPEPFGRVILEALALGRPVVASDAGGVPELIEHERTGLLAAPGDVPALAACIERLLAAPAEAAAMAARGQAWARERFSLARQVAEMSDIYEAAARGPSHS
jgi:glycosyltransferase involved in cell wall biosynthesis